jgi:hypothetical protein
MSNATLLNAVLFERDGVDQTGFEEGGRLPRRLAGNQLCRPVPYWPPAIALKS